MARIKREIEITVCDLCGGDETAGRNNCSRCHRELCGSCSTYIYVRATHVVCFKRGQSRSQKGGDLQAFVCVDCAATVERVLRSVGFDFTQSEKSGAVLD